MSLRTKIIETKPSYFEEVVEKHIWVYAMVEEHESIVKNNVWEVVPRPTNTPNFIDGSIFFLDSLETWQ